MQDANRTLHIINECVEQLLYANCVIVNKVCHIFVSCFDLCSVIWSAVMNFKLY